MKLEHRFTVPAPVDEAWATFNDLERVVPCFPGATLTSVDGDDFEGSCKVKLGPVSLLYTGSGHFVERDPTAYRAVITAKGKDRRGNGTASANVTAQLKESGPSSTEVSVETELTVTGKPAQFGRGLMQDVSDKMLAQFVDCLAKELGPAEAEEAEPAPSGPSEEAEQAHLDLGSTLLPVLAKRLAPYLIGAVLALLLRRLLRR
jgi:carbon monoxide dehydrogenase subunit G